MNSLENDKDVVYGKDNSIIFAIARMNPPTPGHLGLIEILIEQAISKGVDHVYVCLSKTKDVKNPIFCDMKKTVLGDTERRSDEMTMINSLKKTMMEKASNDPVLSDKIHKMKVHLRCVPEEKGATPFTVVKHIINEKIDWLTNNAKENGDDVYECPVDGIKLFLVIGEDRKTMINDIRKCFAAWKQVSAAHGKILERAGMTDLIRISECPELLDSLEIQKVAKDEWSATVVRNMVGHKKEAKFLQLYCQYLTEDVAKKLYDDIAEGLAKIPPPPPPKGTKRMKTIIDDNNALKPPPPPKGTKRTKTTKPIEAISPASKKKARKTKTASPPTKGGGKSVRRCHRRRCK
jgi:hypothetical protein